MSRVYCDGDYKAKMDLLRVILLITRMKFSMNYKYERITEVGRLSYEDELVSVDVEYL